MQALIVFGGGALTMWGFSVSDAVKGYRAHLALAVIAFVGATILGSVAYSLAPALPAGARTPLFFFLDTALITAIVKESF